jgi:ketosteroid isomerase-like protein
MHQWLHRRKTLELGAPLTSETEVLNAADRLVAAFARTDASSYFACFADDASFIFHSEIRSRLTKREYAEEWATWVENGWRVDRCESTERQVQMIAAEGALFTHMVRTSTSSSGVSDGETLERETIVFERRNGQLVAVHEHLSLAPADAK